jgi:hypothetical protein
MKIFYYCVVSSAQFDVGADMLLTIEANRRDCGDLPTLDESV